MRHRRANKKLNREKAPREALYRNLISSLFIHGSITTTATKAKAVKPIAEKLVTEAKKETPASRKRVFSKVYDRAAAENIYKKYLPGLKERSSGYLRILKLGPRKSDDTMMAKIEILTSGDSRFNEEVFADVAEEASGGKSPKAKSPKDPKNTPNTKVNSNDAKKISPNDSK